jgi:pyruvate formate lyase activating enzyme
MMADLPVTTYKQVVNCYRAAKKHLKRVNVGNLRLIGVRDMSEIEAAMK